MTSFRDALAAIRPRAFPALRLPATTLSATAAQAIIPPDIAVSGPGEGKDYDLIADGLGRKIRAGRSLNSKEARDGAWCLWATKPALAERTDTLRAMLDGIEQHDRRKPYRALASAWLSNFDPERPGMREASAVLARWADRTSERWHDLHSRLQLFTVDRGPARVVAEALRDGVSPSAKLREFGLSLADAQSGYAKACAAEGLRTIATDGARPPEVRLRDVELLALDERRALVFSDLAALVGRALLAPYLQGTMPEKAVRDRFLALLIGLFYDPRLASGRWTSMPDCEAVVRRWLTEQSLRQFLDIVDQVGEVDKWSERRAFWEAVHSAGLINDAWVVFGKTGADLARRIFGSNASFGVLTDGASGRQAVLLLKIGRAVVAEWSQAGRCNIWRFAAGKTAPLLNERQYSGNALRGLSNRNDSHGEWAFAAFNHMGDWQGKVAAKIYDIAGRRLDPSEYRLR